MADSSSSTGSGIPESSGKTRLGEMKSKTATLMQIQNDTLSAAKPTLNPVKTSIMPQIQHSKPSSDSQPARIHERAATSNQLNQQLARSIHERPATSDQSSPDNFPLDKEPVYGNWVRPPSSQYKRVVSDGNGGYSFVFQPIPRVNGFTMPCVPENTTYTPRSSLHYACEMLEAFQCQILCESYSSHLQECCMRESLKATSTELAQARAELARAREMHTAAETSWRAERAAWEVEQAGLIRVKEVYDVNARLRAENAQLRAENARLRAAKAEATTSPSSSSSLSTWANTEYMDNLSPLSLTDW